MRITKIKVNNFKSLIDFEIDLSKFNCIVGLNGSGKSTFLQFVSFLSQLMKGGVDDWFQQRKWAIEDIIPQRDNRKHRVVHFEIFFQQENINGHWKGDFLVDWLCCTHEELSLGDCLFESENTKNEKNILSNAGGGSLNINRRALTLTIKDQFSHN